jgi:hypothetical protein
VVSNEDSPQLTLIHTASLITQQQWFNSRALKKLVTNCGLQQNGRIYKSKFSSLLRSIIFRYLQNRTLSVTVSPNLPLPRAIHSVPHVLPFALMTFRTYATTTMHLQDTLKARASVFCQAAYLYLPASGTKQWLL